MRNWKKFIVFTVSLIFLSPLKFGNACGPELPDDDVIRFRLFQPDASGLTEFEPFYFTTHYLNDFDNKNGEAIARKKNINEWFIKFNKKVPGADIDSLLYSVKPEEFATAVFEINRGNKNVELAQNKMFAVLLKPENKALFEYFKFTMEADYYIFEPDPWQETPSKEEITYKALVKNASEKAENEKDIFLKLRYGYQYLKLTRNGYPGDLRAEFYNKHIKPLNSESIVAHWAAYHHAISTADGCAFSNYQFAKLFDKAVDRRVGIYQNFDAKLYGETLKLCKNNREKVLVNTVNELKNPGRALDGIRKIYELQTNSNELVFLFTREINKLEDWILTPEIKDFASVSKNIGYWNEDYSEYIKLNNYKNDKKYLKKVRTFSEEVLTKKALINRAFWVVSSAYLALIDNDLLACEKYLNEASHISISEKMLQNQLHLTRLMLEINKAQKLDAQFETMLAEELNWLDEHRNDFADYWKCRRELFAYLAKKYEKTGDGGRAALLWKHAEQSFYPSDCLWIEGDFYNYIEMRGKISDVDTILNLIDKKGKTDFDNILLKDSIPFTKAGHYYGFYYDESEDITPEFYSKYTIYNPESAQSLPHYTKYSYRAINEFKLLDLKGMFLLREKKVKQAYEIYKHFPEDFWKQYPYTAYLNANPFFVDRDRPHKLHKLDSFRYTKPQILKRMIDLETEALEKPQKRALNYYLLGNAWYNFTYDGNSWMMLRNYWTRCADSKPAEMSFNKVYYGTEMGHYYYKKAFENADDREFAAVCALRSGECFEKLQNVTSAKKRNPPYIRQYKNRFGNDDALYKFGSCDEYNNYVVNFY